MVQNLYSLLHTYIIASLHSYVKLLHCCTSMPNILNGHFGGSFGKATCLKQKAKTWGPMRYLMHTLISGLELTSFAINLIKEMCMNHYNLNLSWKKKFFMIYFLHGVREKNQPSKLLLPPSSFSLFLHTPYHSIFL